MPKYEVKVTLYANIEAPTEEFAKRIAIEGVVATSNQDDKAEADFRLAMPQDTFPRFVLGPVDVVSGDDTPTEDGLDNSEEVA